jgi:hypothetical protein
MIPAQCLIILIAMTTIAALAETVVVHLRRCMLRNLGKKWEMHFAAGDQLRLADRLAGKLPILGAANICVMDLLFSTDQNVHRYIFTVEFGVGVIRGKRRRWRVGGFQEPISRGITAMPECSLSLAPQDLPIAAAYQYVWESLNASHVAPVPV